MKLKWKSNETQMKGKKMNDDLISRCFGRLPVAAFDRVEEKMMYESPITRFAEDIMTDIVEREEGYLVESVHKVGFDIDKEELEKALRYDRDQYEKGFTDGRLSASPKWIPVTVELPKEFTPVNVTWVNHSPESYYADIKDKPFTATAIYYDGEWWWYSSRCEDYLKEYGVSDMDYVADGIEITAWMPLPAPWKGESDDE